MKRAVAQPGSALRSGRRGRWFESSLPDSLKPAYMAGFSCAFAVAIKKGCQLLSQQGNQPSPVNMDSSIRLIKEIDISDGMRLQKGRRAHKLKTHNKDSLLLAAQILARILQKHIRFYLRQDR